MLPEFAENGGNGHVKLRVLRALCNDHPGLSGAIRLAGLPFVRKFAIMNALCLCAMRAGTFLAALEWP